MRNERSTKTSFQMKLDRSRPLELVGEYSAESAVVKYRYTDTGDQVSVPNTWNNRPAELLAQAAISKADAAEKRAEALEASPPDGVEPEQVAGLIRYHRNKAAQLRQSAPAC